MTTTATAAPAPAGAGPGVEVRPRDRFAHPAWLLLVAPIVWLCLWYNLGKQSLHTSTDEAAHTDVARNMLAGNRWIDLWYFEELYYGKPPLKMWLSALLMKALGQEEWVVRLPDATFATLTTLLVWLIARRHLGGPAIVAAPALFVLAPYPLQVHGWREGVQESALTFLMTLATYLFLGWFASRPGSKADRTLLLVGVVLGAGTLVKSVVAFLVYPPVAAFLVVQRRWRDLFRPALAVSLVIAISFFLSWHHGSFLVAEIKINILSRLGAGWGSEMNEDLPDEKVTRRGGQHPAAMYWTWLSEGFHPFGYALPAAGVAVAAAAVAGSVFDRWLFLWGFGLIAPWAIAHLKHPWYVYPAYPALAIALARTFLPPEAWRGSGSLRIAARVAGGVLLLYLGTQSVRQAARVLGSYEQVPLHQVSDWLKSRPGREANPAFAILLPPRQVCPDERYYIDLAHARAAYLRGPNDLVAMAREEPRLVALVAEPDLETIVRAVLPYRRDISICYAAPRCRRAYGTRLPVRVLMSFGAPLPRELPFAELSLVRYGDGFGQVETSSARPFAWFGRKAAIRMIAGCGVLRFRALSFHDARHLTLRYPGGEETIVVPPEGVDIERVVAVPPGGATCELEALEECAVPSEVEPGSKDRRCLGISIVDLRFEADPASLTLP
ncbi:MAG: glycosyltransferase family 39 protein [Acidobacteriota bacterium]